MMCLSSNFFFQLIRTTFIFWPPMLLIEFNSISNMGCHYSRRASARDYTVDEMIKILSTLIFYGTILKCSCFFHDLILFFHFCFGQVLWVIACRMSMFPTLKILVSRQPKHNTAKCAGKFQLSICQNWPECKKRTKLPVVGQYFSSCMMLKCMEFYIHEFWRFLKIWEIQ